MTGLIELRNVCGRPARSRLSRHIAAQKGIPLRCERSGTEHRVIYQSVALAKIVKAQRKVQALRK